MNTPMCSNCGSVQDVEYVCRQCQETICDMCIIAPNDFGDFGICGDQGICTDCSKKESAAKK